LCVGNDEDEEGEGEGPLEFRRGAATELRGARSEDELKTFAALRLKEEASMVFLDLARALGRLLLAV
jgi:hypothetical protein